MSVEFTYHVPSTDLIDVMISFQEQNIKMFVMTSGEIEKLCFCEDRCIWIYISEWIMHDQKHCHLTGNSITCVNKYQTSIKETKIQKAENLAY